jgi:hypothetical protein
MIKLFTCSTVDCVHNINPVFLEDPTEDILCGGCFKFGASVEYIEPEKATKKTSKPKADEATGPNP